MATVTEYGNHFSVEGTLAECMAYLKGKPSVRMIALVHDGTDYTAVFRT